MATSHDTQTALSAAVEDIDALSQEAFTEIAALARLAVRAIKSGDHDAITDAVIALQAIQTRARDGENDINALAEQVGCNYKNPSRRVRPVSLEAVN